MNGVIWDDTQAPIAPPDPNAPKLPDPAFDISKEPIVPGAAPVTNYGKTDPQTGMPYNQQPQQQSQFPRFLDTEKHQLDPRYMEHLRGVAFGDPGSSPWLKYQLEQDQIRQAADLDNLQLQGASNLATAQGDLAMRGGLTSGATERLGQQNLMAQIQGRSQLARSAAAREAGMRQAAEERQREVLMGMPQAELGYSGYHADLDKFSIQEQNKADAAKQMADAIRAQGGDPSMFDSLMGGLSSAGGVVGDLVTAPFQVFNPNNY